MPRKPAERLTRAFPVVISGPSGVGKTTLVTELVRRDPLLVGSVSTTTRPPREGEVDGESYVFVDGATFENLKKGQLIEWALVHGHLYGTRRAQVDEALAKGLDLVLNIDVQGGASVKKSFPDAVLIFILPPSFEELRRRIEQRGTDYARDIGKRLENARGEIESADAYDYIVVNDLLPDAVAALLSIIQGERNRRTRYGGGFFRRFDIED